MEDVFIEGLKRELVNRVRRVVEEAALHAKVDELNAIDTLELVNNSVLTWIDGIKSTIVVGDDLLREIAELERPYIIAAKKEASLEVARIIENESYDISSKIYNYLYNLKRRGIDLDIRDEEEKVSSMDSSIDEEDEETLPRYTFKRDECISEPSCGSSGRSCC